MKKLCLLFVLMGLLLTLQGQHLYEHTYPIVAEENPMVRGLMDQVSKDSLEATINHMQSYHTRRWDSHMVYEVENWLYETYRGMGFDTVVLHDFQFIHHDTLVNTSDNVIAVQRGVVYPDEYVVCGAHYDSYNNSPGHPDSLWAPGADDNASGSAGIIETARLLSRCTFERSILYCGWAAEEVGLKGSRAFANECADQQIDIVGYFNLDMIGYLEEGQDLRVDLIYVDRDSVIGNYVFDFSNVYFPDMEVHRGWYPTGADSDFSSFNRNGYLAIHTFEKTYHTSPFIHSTSDVLGVSVNNMDQAKRYTELNLGLVATLAGIISNDVDEGFSDEIMVFPNPTSGTLTVKGTGIRQLEVFNLFGQLLIKETCHSSAVQLDIASLAAGVYMLRVTDDAMNIHSHRLVKY